MASELTFDVEKLKEAKKTCENAKADLLKTKKELEEDLKELKEEWHTQAGIDFFSRTDTDRAKQVESYAKIAQGVADLLERAIDQYSEVERAAKNLKLKKS